MNFNLPRPIKRFLITTKFWQDNYFLIREFKHFQKIAILAIVFTIIGAAFEGVSVGLLLSFLQSLTDPNGAAINTGIDWIDINVLGANQTADERIYRISLFLILTGIIRGVLLYLGKVYSGYAQASLSHQLKNNIFEQLQSVKLSYFSKTRSGSLINTITTEIQQLKQVFDLIANTINKVSTLAVYLLSMLVLSWQLTILSLMVYLLLTVGISTLFKKIREVSFARTKAHSWHTSVALEVINGIRTIHSSVAHDFERKRFYAATEAIKQLDRKYALIQAGVEPITITASTIVLIGILLFAYTFLISRQQLTLATLFTFLIILFRMTPILRILNNHFARLANFQGSIENISELLRKDNKPYLTNGSLEYTGFKRAITFSRVDFAYEPDNLILKKINLVIEKGQVTALVGGSGAGKSTLVDLLPRFYEVISGSILIDGTAIEKFDIYSLRRKMAIVSQDTFIFNTSVRENIAYGLEGIRDEEIWEAAKLAHAVDFIQELPQGLDTKLGDRGLRLSGGQRQRIAIARALLRDPEILILDEATSALDSVTEKLIQQSLEKLSQGRTVIAIAHRLSTIAQADKVVVLDNGEIIEQGSYQDLLEQQGKLWEYHRTQNDYKAAV